jgi:hypothetical protein
MLQVSVGSNALMSIVENRPLLRTMCFDTNVSMHASYSTYRGLNSRLGISLYEHFCALRYIEDGTFNNDRKSTEIAIIMIYMLQSCTCFYTDYSYMATVLPSPLRESQW